jgi:hypothetical protein
MVSSQPRPLTAANPLTARPVKPAVTYVALGLLASMVIVAWTMFIYYVL